LFLRKKELKIISGADSSHFRSLLQLINSIKIFEKGKIKVLVYDLGLTKDETAFLSLLHPDIQLRRFEYEKYPSSYNININSGNYAWKPAIIYEEYFSMSKNNMLFWLDAGCFVKKPLSLVRASIHFTGFYSPFGGGTNKNWTHYKTIERLGLKGEEDKKMLASGIVGLKTGFIRNDKLVKSWYQASQIEEIIAPAGSSKDNHRQDQSLLSLLYYNAYKLSKPPLISHKGLEILAHKDIG
jgi:hypothetical protein